MSTIRKANPQDAENLAALSSYVWLHTYAQEGVRSDLSGYVLNRFTPEHFRNLVADPNSPILVAEEGSYLQAYLTADLTSRWQQADCGFEVITLYVHPHLQGKGLGRALLVRLADQYGGRFWLTAWVHNEAIGFYKHLGFRDIGRSDFEIDGQLHENRVLAFDSAEMQQ